MTSSQPTQTHVYVISAVGTSLVKIGISNNIEGRRRDPQTGCPFTLIALWATPGGRRLEQRLHECFADRRREGEWFDFAGVDAVSEIKKCARNPTRKPTAFYPSTDIVPVGKDLSIKRQILRHPKLCGLVVTALGSEIAIKAMQKGAWQPADLYAAILANPWGAATWEVLRLPVLLASPFILIITTLRTWKHLNSWCARVREEERQRTSITPSAIQPPAPARPAGLGFGELIDIQPSTLVQRVLEGKL